MAATAIPRGRTTRRESTLRGQGRLGAAVPDRVERSRDGLLDLWRLGVTDAPGNGGGRTGLEHATQAAAFLGHAARVLRCQGQARRHGSESRRTVPVFPDVS